MQGEVGRVVPTTDDLTRCRGNSLHCDTHAAVSRTAFRCHRRKRLLQVLCQLLAGELCENHRSCAHNRRPSVTPTLSLTSHFALFSPRVFACAARIFSVNEGREPAANPGIVTLRSIEHTEMHTHLARLSCPTEKSQLNDLNQAPDQTAGTKAQQRVNCPAWRKKNACLMCSCARLQLSVCSRRSTRIQETTNMIACKMGTCPSLTHRNFEPKEKIELSCLWQNQRSSLGGSYLHSFTNRAVQLSSAFHKSVALQTVKNEDRYVKNRCGGGGDWLLTGC